MSTAEIILGSRLYIDAVSADMPALMKEDETYATLRGSFRELGQWLVTNKLVGKAKDGAWRANESAIDAIDDAKAAEFAPIYARTVDAHKPVLDKLAFDGRGGYANRLRTLHMAPAVKAEATVERLVLSPEDLARVTAASLNLLDAMYKDPANAAFLAGADKIKIDGLHKALETADYLMPGENPDRVRPLGEQGIRGTQEQADEIYDSAMALSSNLKLPATIHLGTDGALTMAAREFKAVIDGAGKVEAEVLGQALQTGNPLDSDITREDAVAAHDVFVAIMQIVDHSQLDTDSLEQVMYPAELNVALAEKLLAYDNAMTGEALKQKDFQAPGISTESGNQLYKLIELGRDIVELGADGLRFTGEEGHTLSGPKALAGEEEVDFAIESAFDANDEIVDDIEDLSEADESDMAVQYGTSDNFARVSTQFIDQADSIGSALIANGVGEALAANAGKTERSTITMSSGRDAAAFATLQEAMGAGRRNSTPELKDRVAENMSLETWNRLSRKQRTPMRVMKFEPGRNEFRDFGKETTVVRDSVVNKRVANWVAKSMLTTNEQTGEQVPNIAFRRMLREAARLPIVAPTVAHAAALRSEAESFVAREAEEVRMRAEEVRSGRDIKTVELRASDVGRFVAVAQASGSKAPATLVLGDKGEVILTHEDAPRVAGKMDRIGNLEKVKPGYKLGLVPVDQLRAAVETGATKVSIGVEDDRPFRVFGKAAEKPVEKKQTRYADITLS